MFFLQVVFANVTATEVSIISEIFLRYSRTNVSIYLKNDGEADRLHYSGLLLPKHALVTHFQMQVYSAV